MALEKLGELLSSSWVKPDDRCCAGLDIITEALTAYRASEDAPVKPLAEGELLTDEMVLAGCRVLYPGLFKHGLKPEARDGAATRSTLAETEYKVRKILSAALSSQLSRPQGEEGLPEQLRGPYFPDEMGTFNAHGWGFGIRVPDEWWGVDTDDVPEEVKRLADTLERTIRAALSNQGEPSS